MTSPFDVNDLKTRLAAKVLPGLVPALKAPLKVAAGEVVDWTSESLALESSILLKGLSGLILAAKQPIYDMIDKM